MSQSNSRAQSLQQLTSPSTSQLLQLPQPHTHTHTCPHIGSQLLISYSDLIFASDHTLTYISTLIIIAGDPDTQTHLHSSHWHLDLPYTYRHTQESPSPKTIVRNRIFNEKTGQTVVMECRAWPGKCTDQHRISNQPLLIPFSL